MAWQVLGVIFLMPDIVATAYRAASPNNGKRLQSPSVRTCNTASMLVGMKVCLCTDLQLSTSNALVS